MLSNQELEFFERIRRIRRYDFGGGSVSLGVDFGVSKVRVRL